MNLLWIIHVGAICQTKNHAHDMSLLNVTVCNIVIVLFRLHFAYMD